MTFYQTISLMNIPCIYGAYKKEQALPYISYTGYGQDIFFADDTHYHRVNLYQIVYYFSAKDEAKEDDIEESLLANGYMYDKSEDFYDSDQDLYYIVYSNIKNLKNGR